MSYFRNKYFLFASLLRRRPEVVYLWFAIALIIPNILLCFSETLPFWASVANIALPLGVIGFLITISRRTSISVWCLFPLVLLAAFQIVLLKLYGNGVIAVDMFLNVTTTNGSEAGELLRSLWPTILLIALIYLPPLLFALFHLGKRFMLPKPMVINIRKVSAAVASVGIAAVLICLVSWPSYAVETHIYPLNAAYNMWLAIKRTGLTDNYHHSSAGFNYNASSLHPDSVPEVMVVVIGETSRADHWRLFGYHRPTTPRLDARSNLIAFPNAFSESNTTHKSVPMLLSPVNANTFDKDIYRVKSFISAFKEAGYYTAFISNQAHNHSFIDFFGQEADTTVFPGSPVLKAGKADVATLPVVAGILKGNAKRKLIIVHTYGSHFNYSDRYETADRKYLPDDCSDASFSNLQNLVNAYDNSILATDRFLDSMIALLKNQNCVASLLYTSDHGEDLYDDGTRFLHASPTPTIHQLHVPMIAWLSDSYLNLYSDNAVALKANSDKTLSTSRGFCATACTLAGVESPKLDNCDSFASESLSSRPLVYLTDHNQAIALSNVLAPQSPNSNLAASKISDIGN